MALAIAEPAPPSARPRPRASARARGLLLALALLPVLLIAATGFTEELLALVAARYGLAARERVEAWDALIRGGQGLDDAAKLEQVNRFFNRLRFVADDDHWGQRDYWATPIEFLGTNGGDCEDFSIAKYFTLREMGVPDERLRITYVRALDLRQAHMVLAYYPAPDADPLILDNLVDQVRPGRQRPDLVPVYSFNGDGLWKARLDGEGRRVGVADGVRPWRALTARMRLEGSPGVVSSAPGATSARP
ncbi:MAG: transglutaminase-like cysteine peptidase [Ectothiorhodospiraceae bacterium]|nr:transglutaminase-like cysteine peptidase [Ectothiorhodospiraceae bacterium]